MSFVNGCPWRQQYGANSSQSGQAGTWASDGAATLPATLRNFCTVAVKDYVHLIGGLYSTATFSYYVRTAGIGSAGAISSWSSTAISFCVERAVALAIGNYVYVFGGYDAAADAYVSTIRRCPINANGTLGSFSTYTESLPTALGGSCGLVTKDRVYLFGGVASDIKDSIFTASIDSSGNVGAFTEIDGALPSPTAYARAIRTDVKVYVLGGTSGATSFVADINEDGTLGSFSQAYGLYEAAAHHYAAIVDDTAFVFGGSGKTTCQVADVTDGVIGTWSYASNSLSRVSSHGGVIIVPNYIYLLGGLINSSPTSGVIKALFSGGSQDYSEYLEGEPEGITGVGDVEGEIDSIGGSGIAPVVGFGAFPGIDDSVVGEGIVPIAAFGSFADPVNDLSAEGEILDGNEGEFVDPSNDLSGYGIVPVAAFGIFTGPIDNIDGVCASFHNEVYLEFSRCGQGSGALGTLADADEITKLSFSRCES